MWAFGCLLEELVDRVEPHTAGPTRNALKELRDACLQPDPAARPSFADLCGSLATAA